MNRYLFQRSRWDLSAMERHRRSISTQSDWIWEISFLTAKESSGESYPPVDVELSSLSSFSTPSLALNSNFFALWYISDNVPPPSTAIAIANPFTSFDFFRLNEQTFVYLFLLCIWSWGLIWIRRWWVWSILKVTGYLVRALRWRDTSIVKWVFDA